MNASVESYLLEGGYVVTQNDTPLDKAKRYERKEIAEDSVPGRVHTHESVGGLGKQSPKTTRRTVLPVLYYRPFSFGKSGPP